MPRTRADAALRKHVEQKKPIEPEEQVDLDGDNDPEMEEEIEYEEVEEEVEDEEEEEEEVEEEEVEEEEEEDEDGTVANAQASRGSDQHMEDSLNDVESKKHAELLSLPPRGSEVYVGGIPNDTTADDLKSFCESIGEVTEVRLAAVKTKRPCAFVTFRSKDLALKAIKDLNASEFKGKKLKFSTAQTKHKLFIGNIPRSWGEEELRKVVTEAGPGVEVIELVKDPQNSSRNRGFAFIEYYNHACADYSREKMSKAKFRLDSNAPTVSWAESKNADSSASSQVKAVYVKNLPIDITEDKLKELFEHHGKITKVVVPPAKSGQKSRFGFVHFADRSSTMKAIEKTEKYEIDGHMLECCLAKQASTGPASPKSGLLPSYPPRMGYGMIGGAYNGIGGAYGAASLAKPLVYGQGPTPGGMAMIPMLLPDGRIGYVLQQPGVANPFTPPPLPRSSRNSVNGGGLSGGRYSSGSDYNHGGGGGLSGGRYSSSGSDYSHGGGAGLSGGRYINGSDNSRGRGGSTGGRYSNGSDKSRGSGGGSNGGRYSNGSETNRGGRRYRPY